MFKVPSFIQVNFKKKLYQISKQPCQVYDYNSWKNLIKESIRQFIGEIFGV